VVKALNAIIALWISGVLLILLGLLAGSVVGAIAAVAYRVFTELSKVL
jgi:hypothetical protein